MSKAHFLLAFSQKLLKLLLRLYISLTGILEGASFEPIEKASYLLLELPKKDTGDLL